MEGRALAGKRAVAHFRPRLARGGAAGLAGTADLAGPMPAPARRGRQNKYGAYLQVSLPGLLKATVQVPDVQR